MYFEDFPNINIVIIIILIIKNQSDDTMEQFNRENMLRRRTSLLQKGHLSLIWKAKGLNRINIKMLSIVTSNSQ